MTIFNYIFDSEWKQRNDIDSLQRRARLQSKLARVSADEAASRVQSLEDEVRNLQDEIGALQLITRALLKSLQATPGWDENAFTSLLEEIDLEDGVRDGKASPPRSEQ